MLTRPSTSTVPAGGGTLGKLRARRAAGDPAAVDEDGAAVGERERRHHLEARPALVHAVVEQDLVRAVERPGEPDGPIAPRAPVGIGGQLCRGMRGRGLELRAQRELLLHAAVLPHAGADEERDAGDRDDRRHDRRAAPPLPRIPVSSHQERPSARRLITLDVMKIVVIAVLIAIVAALFSALVFLYRDRGRGKRVVWLLTVRVALSVSLVAFLLFSYWMGWIGPGGVR